MNYTLREVAHSDPKGDRTNVRVVEVVDLTDRVVAVIYPSDTGCKLLSRHIGHFEHRGVIGIDEYHFTFEL